MNKTLSIIFLSTLALSCSHKIDLDASQSETFKKIYGNAGDDRGVDIQELPNGDFLIFGNLEVPGKSTELALIRTDHFGNEQWTKTFGRADGDIAGGMDINENGQIIICGTSTKNQDVATEENSTDIIVFMVDETGNEIERFVFDFGDNEVGNDISFDKGDKGGYMVVGSSDAERSLAVSDFTPNPKSRRDLLAIRYLMNNQTADTNVFQIGYELDDELNSVVYDPESNDFLAAGTINLQGSQQVQFMALSNLINTVQPWNVRDNLILQGPATVSKVLKSGNNRYGIIGTYNSGNQRLFLLEINEMLSFENDNKPSIEIQKNGAIRGYSFSYVKSDDKFIVTGSTNISDGGGFDHYIASVNRDNTINWEKTYGGTGEEEALAVTATSDGGYIFTGYTGFEGNSLINAIKVNNKGDLNP